MKKKWICLLTALALAAGVCEARPIISGAALGEDLEGENARKCSMTIYPESEDRFGTDLSGAGEEEARVVVDVYKVAGARQIAGYDAYSYELAEAYKGLNLPKEPTAGDWRNLAQEAAGIALGGKEGSGKQEPVKTLGASKKGELSGAGLYLLIARSSSMDEADVDSYRVHMGSEDGDIATAASSAKYTYIFSPELISIPMRGRDGTADVKGPSPEGENGPFPEERAAYTTADGGEWVYDLNVYLKPIRVRRYGSLEIKKKLEVYESEEEVSGPTTGTAGQKEKATFVFKASWTDPDDDKKTESRIEGITFDGAKEEKAVIHRIPAEVAVTVEEIYSGAGYDMVNPASQTVEVSAEEIRDGIALLDDKNAVKAIISRSAGEDKKTEGQGAEGNEPAGPAVSPEASVTFTNTYNWSQKKGYGIKNQFTYEEGGDWTWKSDDTEQVYTEKEKPLHNPDVSRGDAADSN